MSCHVRWDIRLSIETRLLWVSTMVTRKLSASASASSVGARLAWRNILGLEQVDTQPDEHSLILVFPFIKEVHRHHPVPCNQALTPRLPNVQTP